MDGDAHWPRFAATHGVDSLHPHGIIYQQGVPNADSHRTVFADRRINCRLLTDHAKLNHVMNNQAVLSHQITTLDPTSILAATARSAAEVKAATARSAAEVKVNAELVSSAAELSVQAQPLLHAIQLLQQGQQQQNERLDGIHNQLNQCSCAII